MTPTQQFIEDAIAGGWNHNECDTTLLELSFASGDVGEMPIGSILLDPLAWQAVGKTRATQRRWRRDIEVHPGLPKQDAWLFHQHRFIDHLADGKSIDEALTTIK